MIGAGRFGTAVATTLYDLGHEVVVVDRREAAIEAVMDQVTHAIIADATDEQALQKIGVANFDGVVVAIGTGLESNILATLAAKSSGARNVVSKATSNLAARVLTRVGADLVVRPEHDMGQRLARQLAAPSILDSFTLGDAHGVVELEAGPKLVGRLDALRLPNRFGVQVIAVNRQNGVEINPGATFELQSDDRLVVIGGNDELGKLRSYLSE